jgi:hypothetical protein
MFAAGGASTAASGSSEAVPSLLAGSMLSESTITGMPSSLPDVGSVIPGPAMDPALAQWPIDPNQPGVLTMPSLPGVTAPQIPGMPAPAPGPQTGQIPQIPKSPWWKDVLSSTAQVQEMMLKARAGRKSFEAQPAPVTLRSPPAVPAPQLGGVATIPARIPPLQRYAMMLRSM